MYWSSPGESSDWYHPRPFTLILSAKNQGSNGVALEVAEASNFRYGGVFFPEGVTSVPETTLGYQFSRWQFTGAQWIGTAAYLPIKPSTLTATDRCARFTTALRSFPGEMETELAALFAIP
jgi:hypothetical protein